MKTIAILTAGGVGSRMNNNIPKQFLTVNNKPIIMYTLEAFQSHPKIDEIVVPCLSGWESILEAYAKQYQINKLKKIVPGGASGQESITNALEAVKDECDDNTLIMVHDGNRPLVSDEIISNSIATCCTKGNAVAQIPCTEVLVLTDDQKTASEFLNRDLVKRTQTPHTFKFNELYNAYLKMVEMGEKEAVAPVSVMMKLGEKINFSSGSELNFKITNQADLDMFEALSEFYFDEDVKPYKKVRRR